MIKWLIISVSLFALVLAATEDKPRVFGEFSPIPVNSPVLKDAIRLTKSAIVLKVGKVYPNITSSPKIKINAAERKSTIDQKTPTLSLFTVNITLLVIESSLDSQSGPSNYALLFKPILTFNVTISATYYIFGAGEEQFNKHVLLKIIGLPGVDDPYATGYVYMPNQGRPWGPWVFDIPLNDTGLLAAVAGVQNKTWAKISNCVNIERIPGSYIRNDFVITEAHYRGPKVEGYQFFDVEYEAIISLGLKYPSPSDFQFQFAINILATYNYGYINFSLDKFRNLGFTGAKKDSLPKKEQFPPELPKQPSFKDVAADLQNVITDLKDAINDLKKKPDLLPPKEQVDTVDLFKVISKLNRTIIGTVNYLNHLEGSDVVVPAGSKIIPNKYVQETKQLPFFIEPPYFQRTYNLSNVNILSSVEPFKVLVANLSLVLTETRWALSPTEVSVFDEKLVQVNDYVVPPPKKQKLPSLPGFQKPNVDLPGFQKPNDDLPGFQKPNVGLPGFQKPNVDLYL